MNEVTTSTYGLTTEAIVATIVYAFLGIIIMLLTMVVVNKLFNLNMHRELVKEHNTAFGVLIGCMAIAIAIIIGSTIAS